MPPRIRSGNAAVTGLETALAQTSISSTPCSSARAFSSTPQRSGTAQRRWKMHQWLKTRGGAIWNFESQLASPNPRLAGPQSDQPFPLNPMFKSEPVLSEELRNKIYERIVAPSGKWKDRTPYLAVSREFGIDVRRVAAVVRLMEVEKQMIAKKKELATPYANLLATWLPQTPYNEHAPVHHEPINEITVHPSTQKQLFVPTSESRAFTRQDAAKAFHDRLLPADDRSFQRSLINIERQIADGRDPDEAYKQFEKAQRRNERHRESRRVRREAKERKSIKVVQSGRSEVRIKDYSSSNVGNDGRKVGGVGWRYGVPHMDRKRGTIKIPTEVPSQRTAPQQ